LSSITDAYLTGLRADRMVGDGVTRGEKYTYDAAGRVLTTTDVPTDAQSYVETNVYDGLGNRISFTDKNGNNWTYDYDRVGNVYDQFSPVVLVQLSSGTTQTARIQTRYYRDAFGNLTALLEGGGTVDTRVTNYAYDRLNRQTVVDLPGYYDTATGQVLANPAAGGTSFLRTVETTYDAFGNIVPDTPTTRLGIN
jgi:YD repeat-containing protein